MAASRHVVEETIDAVLQQQLVSSSFRVVDRVQKRALLVPGTKAAFSAIKCAIMGTIPLHQQDVDFKTIVDNMARVFGVSKSNFDAKLACLPSNDPSVDARLQLVMLLSVLREHWQNAAYESVIAEIRNQAIKRGCDKAMTTRDALNRILSSQFGSEFSHLVNLYVVRKWGQITGVPVKLRSARITILNKLVANVVKAMRNCPTPLDAKDKVVMAPVPPPGPPGPGHHPPRVPGAATAPTGPPRQM